MVTLQPSEAEALQNIAQLYADWIRGELNSEDLLFMLSDILAISGPHSSAGAVARRC